MCYDVLVAPLFPQPLRRLFPGRHARRLPHMPAPHPLKQQQQQRQQQPPQPKAAGSTASGRHRGASPAAVAAAATELLQQVAAVANGGSGGDAYQLDPTARRQALRLKLQRILVTALAVLLYVKTRSWLAGDQVGAGCLKQEWGSSGTRGGVARVGAALAVVWGARALRGICAKVVH